ncbi:MAG: excinuclease ABC subunit C [Chlorobiaceae bacterium]|nr:excinuclease ABC subunit C [Chlorobiaceae bacterium]
MSMVVYILQSEKNKRYYVGHTENLERRLIEHNSGNGLSTKYGVPWRIVRAECFQSRKEAMEKEKKIKSRGIARYLTDVAPHG